MKRSRSVDRLPDETQSMEWNEEKSKENQALEERVRAAFALAKRQCPESSAFLKTRVLAQLQDNRHGQRLRFWQRIAIGSAATAMALAIFLVIRPVGSSSVFQAYINSPFVVKVGVQSYSGAKYAEVVLPEGVYFYSETYPTLKEQRSLFVRWEGKKDFSEFPFVIRSESQGKKKIAIHFFDQKENKIAQKWIEIEFQTESKKS